MKKGYLVILIFPILLLLFLRCTDEGDYPPTHRKITASFALVGGDVSTKGQTTRGANESMILAETDPSITVSVKEEKWADETVPLTRTSWGTANNTVRWEAGDQIGISMRSSTGRFTSYNNVQYNVTTGAVISSLLTPNSSGIIFPYPAAQNNVKFYAYYPYAGVSSSTSPIQYENSTAMDSLIVNYTVPANQSAQATLRNSDIMCATSSVTNGLSPNVTLAFAHKMVLLTIKVNTTLLVHTLSKVSITGTAATGTGKLNLLTSTLTPNTSPALLPFANNLNQNTPASVDFIINPCTITNNTGSQFSIKLDFSDILGLSRTLNLITNATFVGGTRYIYTISITI